MTVKDCSVWKRKLLRYIRHVKALTCRLFLERNPSCSQTRKSCWPPAAPEQHCILLPSTSCKPFSLFCMGCNSCDDKKAGAQVSELSTMAGPVAWNVDYINWTICNSLVTVSLQTACTNLSYLYQILNYVSSWIPERNWNCWNLTQWELKQFLWNDIQVTWSPLQLSALQGSTRRSILRLRHQEPLLCHVQLPCPQGLPLTEVQFCFPLSEIQNHMKIWENYWRLWLHPPTTGAVMSVNNFNSA